ncbi:hypothetical protein I6E09_03915 [Mediterraneibacter glycyrrhizinilyticus]|uniref:hypothetical protein n=1 Tax=Mediterraneibacter glycyrrhizinilyticus TaxID=342942 RepID=UPI002659A481|nr:hypothetical protein [Mediterraneibacter glycyrrhizinilyticus]MCF2568332.1 hypothetical protein [Mediterraneibacter glycyrrhizinilyticus]
MKREVLLIFLMIVALLTGCQTAGQTSPELPTPENLYSTDNTIDMFVYQETAYVNAEDTDWVAEQEFVKGAMVGKIKNSGVTQEFQDWDATILPVDTEIYETEDPQILLAFCGEELIPYLKYVEG